MRLGIHVIVLFSTLFLVGRARADVLPPEVGACQSKQVGDACTSNGPGVCQAQTCSKLDYANWNRDASSSPPSTTYACNKCVAATSTVTGTQTSTSTPTQTVTNTVTVTPTQTVTNTVTATPTQTSTGSVTVTPTVTATATVTGIVAPTATATVTGTVTPSATSTATTTAKPTETSSTTNSEVYTDPPTTTATVTNTKPNGEPPSNDDGSCSIGRQVTAKRIAPWLLAGAFSLLFLFGRRRRR